MNSQNDAQTRWILSYWWMLGGIGVVIIGWLIAQLPLLGALVLLGGVGVVTGLWLLNRPRWLLYALAFLLAFRIEVDGPLGAIITPQLGIIAIAFAIAVMRVILLAHYKLLLQLSWLPLWLLYVGLGSFSIWQGPVVRGGFQGIWVLYRMVWSAPVMYPLIWLFVRNMRHIRQLAKWLVVGACIASLVAVIQVVTGGQHLSGLNTNYRYLGFYPPYPEETVEAYRLGTARKLFLPGAHIFRAHGTLRDANALGVFLSTALFVSWGLFATSRGKARILWLGSTLTILVGIVATFSRSAWLAVMVGGGSVALWTWRDFWRNRSIRTAAIIGVIVAGLIPVVVVLWFPDMMERFLSIFTPTEVSEVQWRMTLWKYALRQIIKYPLLGTGSSMIETLDVGVQGRAEVYSPHNMIIGLAYQRGLVALGIYASMWGRGFYKGWRTQRRWRKRETSHIFVTSIIAAGVAFLTSGVGTPSMLYHNLASLSWTLIGMTVVLERESKRTGK